MSEPRRLIRATDRGLYCEAGGFYIDPWRPVDRAVVTHAHSDHACPGSTRYLCSESGAAVLRPRVQPDASIQGVSYGQSVTLNGVHVSLHPAGHLLGSAQVRVEHAGRVEVASGDYKLEPDGTCDPFEPLRCHRFITESTFGLPVYRWPAGRDVVAEMHRWWAENREAGRTSVVLAYALGKAQRVLHGLTAQGPCDTPLLAHGAVMRFVELYRQAGVTLPGVEQATAENRKRLKGSALVVAPPSVLGTPWLRGFAPYSTAFASGWMMLRGNRRRRGVDRGFVISDHADWPGLLRTIHDTGCESVGVTHGYTTVLTRYLTEQGRDADVVPTRYEGEREDMNDEARMTNAET